MRAAVAVSPGPVDRVLRTRDVPPPDEPGPGEVVVRITATTVNPSDVLTVAGAYPSRTEFPFVPGFEGVGVVERAGPGVPGDLIGQRVLPVGTAGNWQQRRSLPHAWCVPVPPDVPDEVACFAYINPLTALLMVEECVGAETGEVIVDAATSAIAGHVAELLGMRGIAPIGLHRGTPGHAVADPAHWRGLVTRTSDLPTADVVFDCVGGSTGAELVRLLRPGGTLVHYGLLSGRPLPAECFTARTDISIVVFRLRDRVHGEGPAAVRSWFGPVFEHLRAGRLRTPVAGRHDLDELPGLPLGGGGNPSSCPRIDLRA